MNAHERNILKKAYESGKGFLSPSLLINSIARQDRMSVEHLIAEGYLLRVPEEKPGAGYSINFYILTEKGLMEFKPFFSRLYYKAKVNSTLWVAIASIFFGAISSYASFVSIQSYIDTKKIIALVPEIAFSAFLQEQSRDNYTIPPYFVIQNTGPVPTSQLMVEFVAHEYDNTTGEIIFSFSSEEYNQTFIFTALHPLEIETPIIDNSKLIAFMNEDIEGTDPMIEVKITYREEANDHLFAYKTFYFLTPEGDWVNESEVSQENSVYNNAKQTLLKQGGFERSSGWSDPLYEF